MRVEIYEGETFMVDGTDFFLEGGGKTCRICTAEKNLWWNGKKRFDSVKSNTGIFGTD